MAPGRKGMVSNSTVTLTCDSIAIRPRWPRRPNPVTSVQPVAPAATATRDATSLRRVIDTTAASTTVAGDRVGLDRSRDDADPERLGEDQILAGHETGVGQDPIGVHLAGDGHAVLGFGVVDGVSADDREAGGAGDVLTAGQELARAETVGSASVFHPTRLSANSGRPPMAYTSETLLAAATRPQVRASSTTGVMKSAVDTIARSSSSFQTAASSPVSAPTRSSAGRSDCMSRTTCASSPGASLQPQPAPWLNCVSRWVWGVLMSSLIRGVPAYDGRGQPFWSGIRPA